MINKVKIILCLILLLTSNLKVNSQNIDNASFDSLCVCAIDRIWQWVTSDTYYIIDDTAQGFTPNTYYGNQNWDVHMAWNTVGINYDADLIHYINSVKLFTRPDLVYLNGDKFRGFIMNGEHFYTDANGLMNFSKGGAPFPYRPSAIKGMYQFEDSLSSIDEFGNVMVLLKKFNNVTNSIDTIGYLNNSLELNPTTSWTHFEIPISYYSNETPDSIVVVFTSSSMGDAPTTLWIDGIYFDYVTEINENPIEIDISIFPNPTSNYINIDIPKGGKYSYSISNSVGIICKSTALKKTINLSGYEPGIYFITIYDETKIVGVYKIIRVV